MRPQTRITPRKSNDEKNLIAEQPGRIVLIAGVVLSLILGLSVRGLTAPSKVKAMVESAASKIHKDVHVEFDSAQLSLSNGLFPRFAVVIGKVKMESENECWMTPQLLVDEIRLPLSFWALLRGENPITEVEAGTVEVNLRSPYKNCETGGAAEPAHETPQIKQFVTLKNPARSESPQTPTQVEAILIDQLRISAPPLSEPLELAAFAIRLKSNSPRVIEMTAKTHLLKDQQVGDYLSHATLWGEYTEFPKKSVQGRLSGNWREGSYQLKANYLMKEEEFTSEVDLKHIPLSQVAQIFKKMNWLKEDLNARQVWVSLNLQTTAKKADLKKSGMQIKDLRLEGDLGDLTLPEARIVSLQPLRYFPFTVDIQRLNLERLLTLLNRPHPSPALGQLGHFTGTAVFKDDDHIEISGTHKGLEFIFSNKGQREMQTLREIAGDMKLEKDRWTIAISRFTPDQGAFDGQMQLLADRDFKNLEIKAKAQELRMAPNVVKLMTTGGQIGAFSGDMDMKFQEGRLNSIKGILNSENINVEGVELAKAKMNFDYVKGEVVTQVQAQKLSMRVGSPAFQLLKDLVEPEWMSDDHLAMKNLSAQFRSDNLKALAWRNFQAQLEKGGRISSEGAWDEEGFLAGQIQAQTGKSNHKWLVAGKRDVPTFTLADNTKKKKQ